MSQFNAPVRKAGGSLDVYTGLLFAAFLVLAVGVFVLATTNTQHSKMNANDSGSPIKLIE